MKTVIAATDFSEISHNAVNYAAQLSIHLHAALLLVNVVELPPVIAEYPVPVPIELMLSEAEKNIVKYKEDLLKTHGEKLQITTEAVFGTVFGELERIGAREQPFAIVIGTAGKTGFDRVFAGSHATYLLRHLPFSVIAVPPFAKFAPIRDIVFACDMQHVAETVPVAQLKFLQDTFHARVHVLNTSTAAGFSDEQVAGSRELQTLLEDTGANYVFTEGRHTDDTICDYVVRNQPELLLLLPKHHGIFGTLLHRSHTGEIARGSIVPVMSLHAAKHRKA